MKKILVPTDFTELGDFAYAVANKLAQDTNSEITALSIVPGPAGAIYSPTGNLTNDEGNDYSEWQNKVEKNKTQLKAWASDKPNIKNSIVTIGNIDNTIIRTSEMNNIDLIVMGTEGLFRKSMWSKGSHTEFITNHSNIPVLSLKCDRENIDLNKIVLVGDFLMAEKIDLTVLKAIQEAYNSTLVLLKINTPSQIRTDQEIKEDMELFAKNNGLKNYEMQTYKDNAVEAGIGKFTAENSIDLIAMGTHQTQGFSRLFRGSISDDVVNHLYHPLLTFPI